MAQNCITTSDILLQTLTDSLDSTQRDTRSPNRTPPTETNSLEVLVRLVVRDELLRQRLGAHSDSSDPDGIENSASRTPLIPETHSNPDSDAQVMCAEDVAVFLGVDRNTVYVYAGRGTIPCRRLGKRLLFHRPALVAWLDPSKAASTRKD